MSKVRRLQRIGKQWMINVPAQLVRDNAWRKGVYLEINPSGNYGVSMNKVAEYDAPKTSVELQALEKEASSLSLMIDAMGEKLEGGEIAGRLAQLSWIKAKIWRLKRRLNPQE